MITAPYVRLSFCTQICWPTTPQIRQEAAGIETKIQLFFRINIYHKYISTREKNKVEIPVMPQLTLVMGVLYTNIVWYWLSDKEKTMTWVGSFLEESLYIIIIKYTSLLLLDYRRAGIVVRKSRDNKAIFKQT